MRSNKYHSSYFCLVTHMYGFSSPLKSNTRRPFIVGDKFSGMIVFVKRRSLHCRDLHAVVCMLVSVHARHISSIHSDNVEPIFMSWN